MFVFSENPSFKHPVTVHFPTDNGMQEFTFTGHFVMDPDEDFLSARRATSHEDQNQAEITALKKVFVGWDEGHIQTPDKQSLPINEGTIEGLLKQIPVRIALSRAYLDATRGGALRLGNSMPPQSVSGADPEQ